VGLPHYCKNIDSFTPFQLVYGLEAVLPIECKIPYLKLAIELLPNTFIDEERFVHLAHLEKNRHNVISASEAH